MKKSRIHELEDVYREGLFKDVLPFWIEHCVDQQYGGFMMSLDRDGTLIDTDKGVWQQGRFTWLLGELYNNVENRTEWLELAKHGAKFLDDFCFDHEDGRMWFQLSREGRPVRKRRYAFSESFAAIAYGELYGCTGDKSFAEKAESAMRAFIAQNVEPVDSQPKYTTERSTRGIGFPMITIATAQELRESIGLASADQWIDQSIDTICKYHICEKHQCILETAGPNGEFIDHFDGRTLNPGHAMEAAWFIMQEGKYRSDRHLLRIGCKILEWSWRKGWDTEYGGILYFVDAKGLPVQEYWHDMKFWWPQNEAIIATLLAHQLTGDDKYLQWHHLIHDWTYSHFPDPEFGEWYGYLHRDGRISSRAKGNLWKGPFHIPRMQLQCLRILTELQ